MFINEVFKTKKSSYKKIIPLIIPFALGILLVLLINKVDLIKSKPTPTETKTTTTVSICDEVLEHLNIDSEPVEIFSGKPAEVDFSTIPEAKLYYTAITEAVAAGPNLAGHYTIAVWGCGTDCAGHAIIDSISGKIIKYLPSNEQTNAGNQFSGSIHSRVFVFNPKEYFQYAEDKTLAELIDDAAWDWKKSREYYEIVDEENGKAWVHKICSENVFSGIIGSDISIVEYAKLKQISTSGDARFYWYDIESQEIEDYDNQYSWFFALPKDVPDNIEITDKWVKFLKDNEDSVFRITGLQKNDDCDYYGPNYCVKSIVVKTIEVVGEDKMMEF